jgi:hypothetical protein
MSDKKWTLYLEILAGNRSLQETVRSSQSSINKLKTQAQSDFNSMGRAWNGALGNAAKIGVGIGAAKILMDSAKINHSLTQVALSAGKTRAEAHSMTAELMGLGEKTGIGPGELEESFHSLVKYTGSWDAARESIKAVNSAVAVTGADADDLGRSMSVTADAFNIDLTKPKAASDLLNKMAAMGKGSGGLANVASIMNQIAMPASMSGMGADSALKFVGMLGQVSKNPDQMASLASTTLALFTNLRMIRRMHGVKLFDDSGNRRDPLEIFKDIDKNYEKLDAKGRSHLLFRLSGGGGAKAMRDLGFIFESGAVNSLGSIGKDLGTSADKIEHQVPGAINDAEASAKRLGVLMQHAGDQFAQPVNGVISKTLQWAMDKQGLNGWQMAGVGTAATLTAWLGGRMAGRAGSSLLSKFLGGKAGLAGGVAEGSMLKGAGVQPVYVVNFSEAGAAGIGGNAPVAVPGADVAAKGIGAAGLGIIGISAVALGVSLWAATQEKYRKGANALRGGFSLQGGSASGASFNADDLLRYRDNGLSATGGGSNAPSSVLHKQETHVDVYVDGRKVPGVRTVEKGRGRFSTASVSDSANFGSDE